MRAALALLVALLAAPALAEVMATDASGTVVTVPAPPEEVVCFTTTCVHNLAILGVLPVAASHDNKTAALDPAAFGPAAEAIEVLPWTDGYDLEAILQIAPDLIVSWEEAGEYMPVEVLEGQVPVYVQASANGDAERLDVLEADLRGLATLLGREDRADAFVGRLDRRIAAYDALTGGSASLLIVRMGPGSPEVAVPPSCGAVLTRLAACASMTKGWVTLSVEGLLALDPDVLVIEDWDEGLDLAALTDVPLWSELSAVMAGRVHLLSPSRTLDYSLLSVDASLDAIMPLLYPDVLPAPLTDEQVAAALAE